MEEDFGTPFREEKDTEIKGSEKHEQSFPDLLPSPVLSDQKQMRKIALLFLGAGLFIVLPVSYTRLPLPTNREV